MMPATSDKDATRKMAELLKSGATMLAETCPVEGCHYPLFRLRSGEVVCPVHGRVFIARTEEEAREIRTRVGLSMTLDRLEEAALTKINQLLEEDADPTEIIKWLEVLERTRRIRTGARASQEGSS